MNAAPSDPKPTAQISKTLENYIEQLSKGLETDCYFPKNESSWEELFNLGEKLIAYAALLRSERDEARGRAEAAEARLERLTEIVERNSLGNLNALYEGRAKWKKLETDAQPVSDQKLPTA